MPRNQYANNVIFMLLFIFKLAVCHAEMNAVLFRTVVSVQGCTMYVTLFPCNECAKVIVQSGIKEVFYCTDKPEYTASKKFLKDAKIEVKYVSTYLCKRKVGLIVLLLLSYMYNYLKFL